MLIVDPRLVLISSTPPHPSLCESHATSRRRMHSSCHSHCFPFIVFTAYRLMSPLGLELCCTVGMYIVCYRLMSPSYACRELELCCQQIDNSLQSLPLLPLCRIPVCFACYATPSYPQLISLVVQCIVCFAPSLSLFSLAPVIDAAVLQQLRHRGSIAHK